MTICPSNSLLPSPQKWGLIVYTVLVLGLVLPQFYSTYLAIQVKQDTDEKAFTSPDFTVRACLDPSSDYNFILIGQVQKAHSDGSKESKFFR